MAPQEEPRGDALSGRLEEVARRAAGGGRLPSGAEVRRRGDRRRVRARTLRGVAAVLVLGGALGGWSLTHQDLAPVPPALPTASEPAPAPTGTPTQTSGISAEVVLGVPDGRLLATTAEGGVDLADASTAGARMSRWFLDPLEDPGRHVLRNLARTDDRWMCLQVPAAGSVAIGTCDPAEPIQVFDVAATADGGVTLHAAAGFLLLTPEGDLATTTDAAGATVFRAADPLDPGSVPDL